MPRPPRRGRAAAGRPAAGRRGEARFRTGGAGAGPGPGPFGQARSGGHGPPATGGPPAPAAERRALLDRRGTVASRRGELGPARQYWRELAELQSGNLGVRLGLFDLALATGDRDAAAQLVVEIHDVEGAEGSTSRFA